MGGLVECGKEGRKERSREGGRGLPVAATSKILTEGE